MSQHKRAFKSIYKAGRMEQQLIFHTLGGKGMREVLGSTKHTELISFRLFSRSGKYLKMRLRGKAGSPWSAQSSPAWISCSGSCLPCWLESQSPSLHPCALYQHSPIPPKAQGCPHHLHPAAPALPRDGQGWTSSGKRKSCPRSSQAPLSPPFSLVLHGAVTLTEA